MSFCGGVKGEGGGWEVGDGKEMVGRGAWEGTKGGVELGDHLRVSMREKATGDRFWIGWNTDGMGLWDGMEGYLCDFRSRREMWKVWAV